MARTEADLTDTSSGDFDDQINPNLPPPPPVTLYELERTVKDLPNKKEGQGSRRHSQRTHQVGYAGNRQSPPEDH